MIRVASSVPEQMPLRQRKTGAKLAGTMTMRSARRCISHEPKRGSFAWIGRIPCGTDATLSVTRYISWGFSKILETFIGW